MDRPNEAGRLVVTLLAPRRETLDLAGAAAALGRLGWRVARTTPLTDSSPERGEEVPADRTVVELGVEGAAGGAAQCRHALGAFLAGSGVDAVVQRDDAWRRRRRVVCLDMDSTFVDAEVIDELARAAGVGEEVAAVTAAAMRGELEFKSAFRERLRRLAGLPAEVLERIARELSLTEGAERLVGSARRAGCRVAIVSGGFAWFARRLAERFGLGFDYVFAHELAIADGRLTGEVEGEVIDGRAKAGFVRAVAAREGIGLEQVVAVGDGANDIPMLREAGLGVAFRPRPALRESAEHVIDHFGLDAILYLLGLTDREIDPP